MGAHTFMRYSTATSASTAFYQARLQAQRNYGDRGYTGTIAEKDSFTIIPSKEIPEQMTAPEYAQSLIDNCDSRIDNKWGPAGAIRQDSHTQTQKETWLFFGWASS